MGIAFGFGDAMLTVVPIIVTVGFVLVFGMFIVTAVRGIGTWNRNNASPRLTVPARVVTKRTSVTRRHHHHHGGAGVGHITSSTCYYATFQVDSGDRMELAVSGPEYGMLAEGDQGNLTFQGTRFLSFQRD